MDYKEIIQNIYKKSTQQDHSLNQHFLGHVMRREKLEHLVTIGMIEGKRWKYVRWANKVAQVGIVTEALKVMRDRDAWKVMIAYTKEHVTWLIDPP